MKRLFAAAGSIALTVIFAISAPASAKDISWGDSHSGTDRDISWGQ